MILLRIGLLFAEKAHTVHHPSFEPTKQREYKILILLLKAITLAQVVKFFLLPIMIWNNHTGDMEKKFNFTLVMGYFVYGLIHVYSGTIDSLFAPKTININFVYFGCAFGVVFVSVVSNMQRRITAAVILLALAIKTILSNTIAESMEQFILM